MNFRSALILICCLAIVCADADSRSGRRADDDSQGTVHADDDGKAGARAFASVRVTSGSGRAIVKSTSNIKDADAEDAQASVAADFRHSISATKDGKDVKEISRRLSKNIVRDIGPLVLQTGVSVSLRGEGHASGSATASIGGVTRPVAEACNRTFLKNGLKSLDAQFFCSRIRKALNTAIIQTSTAVEVEGEESVEDSEEVFVEDLMIRAVQSMTPAIVDGLVFIREVKAASHGRASLSFFAHSATGRRPRSREELKAFVKMRREKRDA